MKVNRRAEPPAARGADGRGGRCLARGAGDPVRRPLLPAVHRAAQGRGGARAVRPLRRRPVRRHRGAADADRHQERRRRGRRHRPPGQPPPADDRRAGLRRAAQGLPSRRRTVQERMSLKESEDMTPQTWSTPRASPRPSSTSSAAASCRRWSTRPTRCRCSRTSGGCRRWAPGGLNRKRAGLRSPRRAHLALRPHLPDRDAGRHEHRSDLEPGDLRRAGRVRLPGHALSQGARTAS